MPRNVAGVYTLPAIINPVVPATPIATTWANPTLQDIAQALTDSISRTGNTAITANLKMSGFKHTGAGVASAAGEYVTWNQTGVKFPAMGIGVDQSPWDASASPIDLASTGALWGDDAGTGIALGYNTYINSGFKAKTTNVASYLSMNSFGLIFAAAASVPAGSAQTFVEKFKVTTDGRVYGTALHNNPNSVTGVSNQYVASGTATLNLTSIAGTTGLGASTSCIWMRVGNVVTVSGLLSIQSTSGVTNAVAIGMSLPIASNFSVPGDAGGCASSPVGDYSISADVVNDRVTLAGTQPTGSSWLTGFHFTYEIK